MWSVMLYCLSIRRCTLTTQWRYATCCAIIGDTTLTHQVAPVTQSIDCKWGTFTGVIMNYMVPLLNTGRNSTVKTCLNLGPVNNKLKGKSDLRASCSLDVQSCMMLPSVYFNLIYLKIDCLSDLCDYLWSHRKYLSMRLLLLFTVFSSMFLNSTFWYLLAHITLFLTLLVQTGAEASYTVVCFSLH